MKTTLDWTNGNDILQKKKISQLEGIAVKLSTLKYQEKNTGISHVIALDFIVLHRYSGFTLWRFVLNTSIGVIFPAAFAHFVSASHFGSSHSTSNFSLSLYLLGRSVISDLGCYCCNCFGVPRTTTPICEEMRA